MAASKSFTFPVNGSPASLLQRARSKARQVNAEFAGDAQSGRFEGQGFAGRYKVDGELVTVTFTAKPFVVNWFFLECRLRAFVEG